MGQATKTPGEMSDNHDVAPCAACHQIADRRMMHVVVPGVYMHVACRVLVGMDQSVDREIRDLARQTIAKLIRARWCKTFARGEEAHS